MTKKLRAAIKAPCSVEWDSLAGDERVRYCGACKLNVYNFSSMTAEEVLAVAKASSGKRLCAMIFQRSDGSLYTDNCPYGLRKIRNVLRKYFPLALVAFAIVFRQSPAEAQGLMGAPVDRCFGASGEVSNLADYGYDTVDQVVKVLTATAALAGGMILSKFRFDDARKLSFFKVRGGACAETVKDMASVCLWQSISLAVIPVFGVVTLGSLWLKDAQKISSYAASRRNSPSIGIRMFVILLLLLLPVIIYVIASFSIHNFLIPLVSM